MNFSKFVAIAVSLLPAMLAAPAAYAVPIVVQSGGFATEVDNLNVNGTLYNVTFGLTIDQTFLGNPSGALDAANALAPALNGSPAINIDIPGVETANGFTIADDSLGNGPTVGDPPATVGTWSVNIFAPGTPYAKFAAVPEPATLSLFAGGLMALGAMRRRSRRAQNATSIAP